jgi:hypothetical protein
LFYFADLVCYREQDTALVLTGIGFCFGRVAVSGGGIGWTVGSYFSKLLFLWK